MSRFRQKGQPIEVKVWPIVNWVKKKLKTCQKWLGVHSLEVFTANTRSFQIKTLISLRTRSPLQRRHFSYEPIRTEVSGSRSKSLVYSKLSQKKLKTCQKWFGVHYLELFATYTRPFQIKTIISKDSVTLTKETQFIWLNSERRVGQ